MGAFGLIWLFCFSGLGRFACCVDLGCCGFDFRGYRFAIGFVLVVCFSGCW